MLYYLIQTFSSLLANGLSTDSIKDNPVFINDPKSLPRNPRHCPVLCN